MSSRGAALSFLAFYAIVLVPLALVAHPPLQDYPNHIARIFILNHADDPFLSRFYAPAWSLTPNLAFELITLPLSALMSEEQAGRVFLAIAFAVVASAPIALHRALWGRYSPMAFLGFPLIFNFALQKGFLGYFLGVGLAVWAYAIWIATARLGRWQRLAIAQGAAIVLFVSHLYALGVFAVLVGVHEFAAATRARGLKAGLNAGLWASTPFILPALVFLLASPTSGGEIGEIKFDLALKLLSVISAIILAPSPLSLLVVLMIFLTLAWALIRARPAIHRDAVWPIVALFAVSMVLPQQIFSSYNADWRVLVPLALVVVGAINEPPLKEAGRAVLGLWMLAAAATAAYSAHSAWRDGDAVVAEFDRLVAEVPSGATVFPVILDAGYLHAIAPPAVLHIASRVVRRRAFTPNIFAFPSQQPIAFREPWEEIRTALRWVYFSEDRHVFDDDEDEEIDELDWSLVGDYHDHVLLIHTAPSSFGTAPELPVAARPVARSQRFTLYRILSSPPQMAEPKAATRPAFGKN